MRNKLSKEQIKAIKNELIQLGFNMNSIGVFYWIEAFKLVYSQQIVDINGSVCIIRAEIAKKNNTTMYAVERAMRTALEPAKHNIQKKYNYAKPIKQVTFLNIMRLLFLGGN